MLPTFVVIGAAKAGTTSLHSYLSAHPQVFMSEPKELDFFLESHASGGDVGWYEDRFAAAGDARARGESSPRYTMYPDFPSEPARMSAVLPGAGLVYLVRHPIERAVSHYAQRRLVGIERRPLARALLEDPVYLGGSRYAFQLERYLRHYQRDRVLILRAEDLRDRRRETLGRVFRFIGVDDTWGGPDLDTVHNQTEGRLATPTWAQNLRTSRWYGRVKGLIPARLRRALTNSTMRHLPEGALTLDVSLEGRMWEMLRDDLARFRALAGDDIVASWREPEQAGRGG